MSLRRKMALQITAMIVGLLVIAGAALWGLDAVREDYGLAAAGYQQLRQVFEVGSHLATARTMLQPGPVDRGRARAEVESAVERFELFSPELAPPNAAPARVALRAAANQLRTPAEEQTEGDVLASDAGAVSAAMGKIGDLAAGIRANIEAHQASARHKHAVTTRIVAGVGVAVVLAAVILGIAQYRSVMSPLSSLRIGVRKITEAQFAERLSPIGSEEFVELARDFNRMAEELDGFYHHLEQQVASKSKELVRSERLASVGYLAAGVAHEINNPLGIISGYAEYSLEQLRKRGSVASGSLSPVLGGEGWGEGQVPGLDAASGSKSCPSPQPSPPSTGQREPQLADDLSRALTIICEEAFRCKDITAKLLSLARQGDETRRRICLADVVDQVAAMIGGLPEFRRRILQVDAPTPQSLRAALIVNAVEAEMKQIVLNLALNALEASAENGTVRLAVSRSGDQVELVVSDNGRGMAPQTLERVFEPFFTDKRGSRDPGTGLGLSITFAIVQSHGGTLSAASAGLGKGSQFTVRLPAGA